LCLFFVSFFQLLFFCLKLRAHFHLDVKENQRQSDIDAT